MPRTLPVLVAALLAACGSPEPPRKLAPKVDKLEPAPAPQTPAARRFVIVGQNAEVRFEMEAPLERQDGAVPAKAVTGQLHVDLEDITKSTGLVTVDISELEIYQQMSTAEGEGSGDGGNEYGERTLSKTQNEHMRNWLEIGDDAPPGQRRKNRRVDFSLRSIRDASEADINAMSGTERTVRFWADGEFLLHQRKTTKSVQLQAVFRYAGHEPVAIDVRTVQPLEVDLAEHDVRPRTAFGALAEKTLGAMSPKVGKQALVSVKFTAEPPR